MRKGAGTSTATDERLTLRWRVVIHSNLMTERRGKGVTFASDLLWELYRKIGYRTRYSLV